MSDAEIEAMGKIADTLGDLEEEVRARVLRWAGERYGVEVAPPRRRGGKVEDFSEDDFDDDDENGKDDHGSTGESGTSQPFEHFAELYDAANPSNDQERALVAAYWTQVNLGKSPFGSAELNRLLKDLGHGIMAINKAMLSNMKKKPALILQVSRGGTAQQARKKYKVTDAGLRWIKARLAV